MVTTEPATLVTFEAVTLTEAFSAAAVWVDEHPGAITYSLDYDGDVDDRDVTTQIVRATVVLPEQL